MTNNTTTRSEMRSCRVTWITSHIPRQRTALRYDSARGQVTLYCKFHYTNVTRRSELRPQLPKLRLVGQGTEDPEHDTSK